MPTVHMKHNVAFCEHPCAEVRSKSRARQKAVERVNAERRDGSTKSKSRAAQALREAEEPEQDDDLARINCERCLTYIRARPLVYNRLRALELERHGESAPCRVPQWGQVS